MWVTHASPFFTHASPFLTHACTPIHTPNHQSTSTQLPPPTPSATPNKKSQVINYVLSGATIPPWVLLTNAVVAFALNMAVFLLIGKTSALTMNIAGVVKDWMLIGLSVVLYKVCRGCREGVVSWCGGVEVVVGVVAGVRTGGCV